MPPSSRVARGNHHDRAANSPRARAPQNRSVQRTLSPAARTRDQCDYFGVPELARAGGSADRAERALLSDRSSAQPPFRRQRRRIARAPSRRRRQCVGRLGRAPSSSTWASESCGFSLVVERPGNAQCACSRLAAGLGIWSRGHTDRTRVTPLLPAVDVASRQRPGGSWPW
jgi:hypothetical protein